MMFRKYRITCEDGSEYNVEASKFKIEGGWIKFYFVDGLFETNELVVAISDKNVSNVQVLGDDEIADKISCVR